MHRWAIVVAGFLTAFSAAWGQSSNAPNEPPPTVVDVPEAPTLRPSFWNVDNFQHENHRILTGEAEYLLWFVRGARTRFPFASFGGFSDELGDTDRNRGPVSGGRFTLGTWRTESNPWVSPSGLRTLGVEARFFFVCGNNADFSADAPPTIARPFFDLNSRTDSSFLVASPGIATGSIDAHGRFSIWGAEANIWKNIYYNSPGTSCAVDLLAGFRYLNANSELEINSLSVFNNTISGGSPFAAFAGNRLTVTDSFAARNHFFGGQIGIGGKHWIIDNLSIEGSVRVAFGSTQQDVTINGSQLRTLASGTTVPSVGGVLALPSNMGTRSTFKFTQVPEANFKAVWPVANQLTLTAGFTALYWNRVARAADQIDRSIDVTQIPNFPSGVGVAPTGLGRPAVPFRQSELWLLGISAGIEFSW